MQPLRIGVVKYLNTLPLYYCLQLNAKDFSWHWVEGTPAELNLQLRLNELDVAIVSSFEYALQPELYQVLPDLSISADGAVRSIYLFAHQPFDQVRGKIKLTAQSLTSIHLLKCLLAGQDAEFVAESEPSSTPAMAELKIGDDAIQTYYQDLYPYAHDLSAIWKQRTGLPFVFALWCVNKQALPQKSAELKSLWHQLKLARDQRHQIIDELSAQNYQRCFPSKHACMDYFTHLQYDLSSAHIQGFELFQQKCVKLGLLRKVSSIQFFLIPN